MSKTLSDPSEGASSRQYGNKAVPSLYYPNAATDPRTAEAGKVERKLNEMEKKLDSILKKLEEAKPTPQPSAPEEKRPRRDRQR